MDRFNDLYKMCVKFDYDRHTHITYRKSKTRLAFAIRLGAAGYKEENLLVTSDTVAMQTEFQSFRFAHKHDIARKYLY